MRRFLAISIPLFLVVLATIVIIHQFTGYYFVSNDHFFHFYRSQGDCFTEHYKVEECGGYPPLLAWLTPFPMDELGFIIFILFLLIILIPQIIYVQTGSLWSLAIYYPSLFIFNVIYAGIYAQGLLALWFTLMLSTRLGKHDLLLLFLGFLTHSYWAYVLIPTLVFKAIKDIEAEPVWGYVFLKDTPMDFSTFFKLIPISFWLYALSFPLAVNLLMGYFLYASFTDFRASLFIPLIFSLYFPEAVRNRNWKAKVLIALTSILFFFMQFWVTFFHPDGVFWLNQKV